VCVARGVYFILEQPVSSTMFDCPLWAGYVRRHPEVRRIRLEMGAYGLQAPKDTVLLGTAPYPHELERRLSPEDRRLLREHGVRTVDLIPDGYGRRRPRGSAELKGTQSYPLGLGAAHALAFQAYDHAASLPAAAGCGAASPAVAGGPASSSDGSGVVLPPAAAGAWDLSDDE
ncbi:MAG: hypothetical protein GY772_06380, partial [bacterium]|nr:hypothetical protein [bacterium]